VPLKALAWLFQADGPLRCRPEADRRQWRWLASFLANCRTNINRKTTARLLALGELSRSALADLALTLPLDEFSWRDAGKMVVYRSPKTFNAARARLDAHVTGEVLSAAECVAREPALMDAQLLLAGGIFNPGEAVADCHAFCQALAARLAAHPRFRGVRRADARRIVVDRGQVRALDTSAGIDLPLYPLKGYSLSAPIRTTDCAPHMSVTDIEHKVLYARIGDALRVAAMVDLVGDDLTLEPRRVASLMRQAPGARRAPPCRMAPITRAWWRGRACVQPPPTAPRSSVPRATRTCGSTSARACSASPSPAVRPACWPTASAAMRHRSRWMA